MHRDGWAQPTVVLSAIFCTSVEFMFEFQAKSIWILTIEQVRKPVVLTHFLPAGQRMNWLAQRQLTWSTEEMHLTSLPA